jgi:hypothetical protein
MALANTHILIVDDEKHTRDGPRRLPRTNTIICVAEDIRGAIDVPNASRSM